MEHLRDYLNSLPVAEQHAFATRCKTTAGYLRKAISVQARLSESTVIAIERESNGAVKCEHLRPDVDWAFLRNTRSTRARRRPAA